MGDGKHVMGRKSSIVVNNGDLDEILKNSTNVIYKVDIRTGRLVYWSNSFLEMTGLEENHVEEHNWDCIIDLIHPADRQAARQDLDRVQIGKRPSNGREFQFRFGNGDYRWMKAFGTIIMSSEGEPESLIVELLDVSEVKRVEHKIIETCDEFKSQLASDIHNNLQQLIGGVQCFTESLKYDAREGGEADQMVSQLAVFLAQAQSECRRISHGLCPVDVKRTGLKVALENLCSEIGALYDVSCTLQWYGCCENLDDQTGVNFHAIAREAAFNSAKHSESESILISLDCRNGDLCLQVSDNGIGFSKEEQRYNAGLGINLMRMRAESMGARLEVGRMAGGGAFVRCVLQDCKCTLQGRE